MKDYYDGDPGPSVCYPQEEAVSDREYLPEESYGEAEELYYIDEAEDPLPEQVQPEQAPAPEKDRKRGFILISIGLFTLLFVGMIVYLGYFYLERADMYSASSYNSRRQGVKAGRFIRGDILSSDGVLLATTKTAEDGSDSRVYPVGSLFAHVVGYSTRGSMAAEALASASLMESHIPLGERIRAELSGTRLQGDTVVLTLDSRIQQAAYDALGDRRGAIVVIDTDTGRILAMVSKPDFDPNEINEIWDELISDESDSRLVNRAAQGKYPPGSTFKIVTTLEYIRENPDTWQDFSYECDSVYEAGDYSISCAKGISHGSEDIVTAFSKSCNGAFATLGRTLEIPALYRLCETLGFNDDIDIGLVAAQSTYSLEDDSSVWDVLQTSIGQGKTQVTPLFACMLSAAVANGGEMMTPYVTERIENADGKIVKEYQSTGKKRVMTEEEADILAEMMRAAVTDGTGSGAECVRGTAGKTGSAEWATGRETHSWFTGFAPYDDPKYAVCVLIEEGGSGSKAAAPAAGEVFEALFE